MFGPAVQDRQLICTTTSGVCLPDRQVHVVPGNDRIPGVYRRVGRGRGTLQNHKLRAPITGCDGTHTFRIDAISSSECPSRSRFGNMLRSTIDCSSEIIGSEPCTRHASRLYVVAWPKKLLGRVLAAGETPRFFKRCNERGAIIS